MLIVETADMLQAPLFTAEALLRAHGTLHLFCIRVVTHAQYLSVLEILRSLSTASSLDFRSPLPRLLSPFSGSLWMWGEKKN